MAAATAAEHEVRETKAESTRKKDELWWTELELRRLGNAVAEMLNSKRYARDAEERRELRTYLDAMKRKSLRVLHRAEQVGDGSDSAWRGLETTIDDPLSLAEEYVRIVEHYEMEFTAASEANGWGATLPNDAPEEEWVRSHEDEWEKQDAEMYKAAVEREKKFDEVEGRKALLGDAPSSELRQRRGKLSQAEEELLARHQPVQDQLTAQLADAVGKLKGSVSRIGEQIKNDNVVVDETTDAVDANLDGIKRQRAQLAKLERSSSVSWWMLIIIVLFALFAIAFVLVSASI